MKKVADMNGLEVFLILSATGITVSTVGYLITRGLTISFNKKLAKKAQEYQYQVKQAEAAAEKEQAETRNPQTDFTII